MSAEQVALSSEARISIASPCHYLGQLCRHLGHRNLATCDQDHRSGRIAFPDIGVCMLEADDGDSLLVMRARAVSAKGLVRLEDVVARHLQRYAFRGPVKVTWVRSA